MNAAGRRLDSSALPLCSGIGIAVVSGMDAYDSELKGALHSLGHRSFRPGQKRIIRDLLSGRDVLAVLPTGSGKSLVYQLAAQLLPGATIVVSPLIALMKDQVESIEEHGLEAGVVDSTQSEAETAEELREVRQAEAKLLYVTPERFEDERFMEQARRMQVSLFVVDEAHCIFEWGHDFRPSYLRLAAAAVQLGRPVLLALTATATPWIRREIVQRLEMRDPDVVVRGVDRPNLFLEVLRVEAEDEDYRMLHGLMTAEPGDYLPELGRQLTDAMQGSGIVYTRTTRGAEETAAWLREWGIPADCYHGRRKKADRERVQDGFMAGDLRVIASTNAFGLGVDKPDVRFVIHRDVPANLESYYQEAGRAGRDGEFARCTLLYRPGDLGRAAFLSGTGRLTREEVRRARDGLLAVREGTMKELQSVTGLGEADLARLVAMLKRQSIAEERGEHLRLLVPDFDPDRVSLQSEEHRRAYERSRLEMVRGYAESTECRRRYILNYFGQELESERCGSCDNDVSTQRRRVVSIQRDATQNTSPYVVGDRVLHSSWGPGIVQRVEGEGLTVLFEGAGYKTLSADVVRERGLLKKAA